MHPIENLLSRMVMSIILLRVLVFYKILFSIDFCNILLFCLYIIAEIIITLLLFACLGKYLKILKITNFRIVWL